MKLDQPCDLFGEAIRPRRSVGRPTHAPTEQLHQRVRELQADGLTQYQIADAIGVSRTTLYQHYRLDLDFWKGPRHDH